MGTFGERSSTSLAFIRQREALVVANFDLTASPATGGECLPGSELRFRCHETNPRGMRGAIPIFLVQMATLTMLLV